MGSCCIKDKSAKPNNSKEDEEKDMKKTNFGLIVKIPDQDQSVSSKVKNMKYRSEKPLQEIRSLEVKVALDG